MLDIQPTTDPRRFTLAVTSGVSVGPPEAQFLFGGAGLGAALAALEAVTERPTLWATAHYLSFARPPATLELEVVVPAAGRTVTQARVVARVGTDEVLTVNAALGTRPGEPPRQWATMPAVPPPGECPAMVYGWRRADDDVNARFEQRVADGSSRADSTVDGRSALWVRPVDPAVAIDRISLALMADFLPSGIGRALGRGVGGNSLDNTIRFGALVPTCWVLCDTHIELIADGFAHGRMHLFAEDGTLLGIASQSMIVRG